MIVGDPSDFAIWFDAVESWSTKDFSNGCIALFIDGTQIVSLRSTLNVDMHMLENLHCMSTELAGNLNLAGNLANTAMASAAGNAQKAIEGNASGTTKSAIATGTVTITDGEAQQAKTGKTIEETLASLNRDIQHANKGLGAFLKSGGARDKSGSPLLDLSALPKDQKMTLGDLFGDNTVKEIVPDGQR